MGENTKKMETKTSLLSYKSIGTVRNETKLIVHYQKMFHTTYNY